MEAMIEDRLGDGRSGGDRSQTAAATPATQARTNAPGAASRTILVVDDDRFLVEATRTLLTLEGFVALGAFGGAEALAQARLLQPDLILMDLGMPGMTGEETLRHLRDDATTREIPVIITTGDDVAPALEGAAAILTKPVTRDRLISAIEAAARPAQPRHILGGNHG